MSILDLLSYFKGAALVFLISLCLAFPSYAEVRDVTLQWDKSIDDPYIQSYNVYYYTISGNPESLNAEDYAASYTLLEQIDPITITNVLKPITIDKSNTQITLHFTDNSKDYYFVVTSVDTRGIEGVPTPEISIIKLTVSRAGTGAGTVTSSQLGIRSDINCASTVCSADYTGGTTVTLTATPDEGNAFTGWSGGVCVGTGLCSVTVNSAATATATFMPLRRLDVLKTGTGTGTVSGSPSGISDINCGTACSSDSTDYIINTLVTLTAAPDAGSAFAGWSGCPGTGPCDVTMDMLKIVTAMFVIKGDINLDGTLNLADAILALQALVGLNPPGIKTDKATLKTDVNGDNKIDLAEVIYILQKAADNR